jgi:hypothetical protein
MPVHDWSRVDAGVFHDFHTRWIAHLAESLNDGLLPDGVYALAEQRSGQVSPDVLALHTPEFTGTEKGHGQAIALADAPPQVALTMQAEGLTAYGLMRRTLVIRHVSDDRIVALVEIASPANKDRVKSVEEFADKIVSALRQGVHVLLVDVILPRSADPGGLHVAIWEAFAPIAHEELESGKPLTSASYCATQFPTAYVQPFAVGDELPRMPLFLDPEYYVNVPLAATYDATYRGVPKRWREVIEGKT